MEDVPARYRVEVHCLGTFAYSWQVFSTSATSRVPLWHGAAWTKRAALRAGERRVRRLGPVLTKEVP